MGFLWAEIPLANTTQSWRYYNELIWYYYSMAGILPLTLLTIYKFIRKSKGDLGYRQWDDLLTLPFVSYGPVYYLIDASVSLWDQSFWQPCRFALLYHHIIAITIVPFFFLKQNVLWFETLVWIAHALTMFDEDNKLYIAIYLLSLFYLTYKIYSNSKSYPSQAKYFGLLYYCFFLFIHHDCQIPTPNL